MKFKVMADYHCWPIWHDGGVEVGPIEPATLGLPAELVDAFDRWQSDYDRSLNMADPASSMLADEAGFEREGRRLAEVLQQTLGPAYTVRYWTDPPTPKL